MNAMKRLEEIAKADFDLSPYWMFYSGSNDKFTPGTILVSQDHPDYDKTSVRLIRAAYALNSGLVLDGFLYETPPRFRKHTIFIKDTGFETWYGIFPPNRESISFIYDMLELGAREVFPITWHSYGWEYSGRINGFGYTKNGMTVCIQ